MFRMQNQEKLTFHGHPNDPSTLAILCCSLNIPFYLLPLTTASHLQCSASTSPFLFLVILQGHSGFLFSVRLCLTMIIKPQESFPPLTKQFFFFSTEECTAIIVIVYIFCFFNVSGNCDDQLRFRTCWNRLSHVKREIFCLSELLSVLKYEDRYLKVKKLKAFKKRSTDTIQYWCQYYLVEIKQDILNAIFAIISLYQSKR